MRVRPGLEVLLSERIEMLRHKRVGVIAHPSSVDSRLRHIVDLFFQHPEIDLTVVMGPQHGARGETQDNMIEWEDYHDSATGLPVYSLYGKTRKPDGSMLADVDVVVFDLQDVGARYYTYIHTMALVMEVCREFGKALVVLDRPNPINGIDIEGPVLDPRFRSFVGLYPLAIRHGMTAGELALYLNSEFEIGCTLEVLPMRGWRRSMFFDQTGLPWVMPSPNLPTLESAIVYPGMCLLEGTNISEGRGTTRPFELSGAPWIEPRTLMERLEAYDLPGVLFRPVYFIPTFHKWKDEMIGGFQLHVLDRQAFRPFRTALALLQAYRECGGERFAWRQPPYEYEYEKLPFDILCGSDSIRLLMESGSSLDALENSWLQQLERFRQIRFNYLLY